METQESSHIHQSPTAERAKESILVIDDNADALFLQRLLLEQEGFKVFTAESGTDAMAILSSIDGLDLILLDMQMEDMSGLDFLKILEERQPQILRKVPVVFLSGMNSIPSSKAVGFIRKPMDNDKFLAAVHRYIEAGKADNQEKQRKQNNH